MRTNDPFLEARHNEPGFDNFAYITKKEYAKVFLPFIRELNPHSSLLLNCYKTLPRHGSKEDFYRLTLNSAENSLLDRQGSGNSKNLYMLSINPERCHSLEICSFEQEFDGKKEWLPVGFSRNEMEEVKGEQRMDVSESEKTMSKLQQKDINAPHSSNEEDKEQDLELKQSGQQANSDLNYDEENDFVHITSKEVEALSSVDRSRSFPDVVFECCQDLSQVKSKGDIYRLKLTFKEKVKMAKLESLRPTDTNDSHRSSVVSIAPERLNSLEVYSDKGFSSRTEWLPVGYKATELISKVPATIFHDAASQQPRLRLPNIHSEQSSDAETQEEDGAQTNVIKA